MFVYASQAKYAVVMTGACVWIECESILRFGAFLLYPRSTIQGYFVCDSSILLLPFHLNSLCVFV